MSMFRLGKLKESGKRRKGVTASHAATAAEISEAIDSSFITEHEARAIALHALVRSRQWQQPANIGDKRLYRNPKESEDQTMLSGITLLPDPL